MLAFGVMGILIFILIYFVMRAQTLQREVALSRSGLKSQTQRATVAFNSLTHVCLKLQHIYTDHIETASTKGLISTAQYQVPAFLMSHFAEIVLDCYQGGKNTEEALTRLLGPEQTLTMEDVRRFMQEQPSQIRMAWAKNTPDSFISACEQLCNQALGKPLKGS